MARKIFNPQRYGSGFKEGYKTSFKFPFEDEPNQRIKDRVVSGGRSRGRDPGQHSMSGKNQEAMARTIAQQRGAGDDEGTVRYIQRRMEHEQLKNVNQFVSNKAKGKNLHRYYTNIARTFDTDTISRLHGLYQEGESMAIPTRPNKMESGQTVMHNATGMIGVLNECTTMADRTKLVLQDRTLYVQSDEPGWTVLMDSAPVAASSAQGPALFKEQVDGPKKKKKDHLELQDARSNTTHVEYDNTPKSYNKPRQEKAQKDGTVSILKSPRTSIPKNSTQRGPGNYSLGPGLSAASGLAHSHPGGMEGFQKFTHSFAKENNLPSGTQIMMLSGKGTKLPDDKYDPTKTSSAIMSIGDHATYDTAKPPTRMSKKSGKEKTVGFAKMYKKANKVPIQDTSNRFKGAQVFHGEMEGKPFTAYANIPKDGVVPNAKKQDYHTQTQGKKKIESKKTDFISNTAQTRQRYADEYTGFHKELAGLPEGHPKISKLQEEMAARNTKMKGIDYFNTHLAKEWGKNPMSVHIHTDSSQKSYERSNVEQRIKSEADKKSATPAPVRPGFTSSTDRRKWSEGTGALIPGTTKGAQNERQAHQATIAPGRSPKGIPKGKESVQRMLDLTKPEDFASAKVANSTIRLHYPDESGRDTRKIEVHIDDLAYGLAEGHQKGYGLPSRASALGRYDNSSTENVKSTTALKDIMSSSTRSPKRTKKFKDKSTGKDVDVDMAGHGYSIGFKKADYEQTTSMDPRGGKERLRKSRGTMRTSPEVDGSKNIKGVGGDRILSRSAEDVAADQKSATDASAIRHTESNKGSLLYKNESKAYGREIKDKQTKPKSGKTKTDTDKKKKEKTSKSSAFGGTQVSATLAMTSAAEKFDAERLESLGETTATSATKKKKPSREYADMGPFPGFFSGNI